MTKKFFDIDGELKLPTVIEIEPTNYCNLRCRMCHVSYQAKGERHHIELEALRRFRSLTDTLVVLGSNFEPMMHPSFSEMLSMFRDFGFRLDIITNGTLLNDEIIDMMTKCNFNKIGFSFDGIRKETYESIRRNAHYERTIENILKLRKAFEGRETHFTVNNVIMRCNIDELIETIDFWDTHNFDRLGLIFMVSRADNEWVSQQSLYPIRDYAYKKLDEAARHVIENKKTIVVGCPHYSKSPLREVYLNNFEGGIVYSDKSVRGRRPKMDKSSLQRGSFCRMQFKGCRSAFVFARILANGDVQLCHKAIIGNIHTETFDEIWFGEKADAFRQTLIRTTEICENCMYWLFCLNQSKLDTNEIGSYLGEKLRPPSLIEKGYKGFNIISFKGKFYGLAQDEGKLNLDKVNTPGYRCVVGESAKQVKQLVDEFVDRPGERVRLSSGQEIRILVEEGYNGFNIISLKDKFYGLAQSEGRLNLEKVNTEGYRCVVGESVAEVKELINHTLQTADKQKN
jgi:radical SAM protein with 4Fe4S-binding SPASM domain